MFLLVICIENGYISNFIICWKLWKKKTFSQYIRYNTFSRRIAAACRKNGKVDNCRNIASFSDGRGRFFRPPTPYFFPFPYLPATTFVGNYVGTCQTHYCCEESSSISFLSRAHVLDRRFAGLYLPYTVACLFHFWFGYCMIWSMVVFILDGFERFGCYCFLL